MASITIRNLAERTKEQLRVRAAHHRRSMEEEARNILRTALANQPPVAKSLADSIRARFAPFGGVDVPIAVREPMREPLRPKR
jgi:antitoxin FitA